MGFFSGVFDSDKLADAINTTKNATKNITGKVAGSFAESAGEMKKFSEETKKMKQPVEGAIMRYGVAYKGGLAKYLKQQSGEIGLNIMEECFYLNQPSAQMTGLKKWRFHMPKSSHLKL